MKLLRVKCAAIGFCVLSLTSLACPTMSERLELPSVQAQPLQTHSVEEKAELSQFMNRSKAAAESDWVETVQTAEEKRIDDEQQKQIKALKDKQKRKKRAEKKKRKAKRIAARKLKKAKEKAKAFEKQAKMRIRKAKKEQETSKDAVAYSITGGGRSSWKSWMPYLKEGSSQSIFSTTSSQYALQQHAYTGDYGIRMVDERYCVAVGSHYADTIGTKLDIELANGTVLKCILADQKADKDTDPTNSYHLSDGSFVEFVVDKGSLDEQARKSGNVGSIPAFEGGISRILVYK